MRHSIIIIIIVYFTCEVLVSTHCIGAVSMCGVDHVARDRERLTGHSVGCFKTSLEPNSCTDQPTQNNRVNWHTQNMAELQPNEFLIAMNRLLAINKGMVYFPQRKQLPRSTANSAVTVYNFGIWIGKDVQGSGTAKTSGSAGKNGRKEHKGSIMISKFISEKGKKGLWSKARGLNTEQVNRMYTGPCIILIVE